MNLRDPLEHPSAELLAGYLDRALSRVQQTEIEGHLTWCNDCRLAASETAGALAMRRRRRYNFAAIGTAAAAAAVIAVLWIRPAVETDSGTPAVRTPAAREGAEPVIPVVSAPENASLSEGPLSFVWGSVGPGLHYRFSLSAPDGSEIWGSSLVDTFATLPPDIEIVPGKTYVWFADALLPDGRTATTGLRRITIQP